MITVWISKAAEIRMAEIWDYSVDEWGEEQASEYLREINAKLQTLANCKESWRRLKPKRLRTVAYVPCGRHFVFFQEVPKGFKILSILHQQMDVAKRLEEDLK